jgi:hypothetical protein
MPQVLAGNRPIGPGAFGFLNMGFNNNPLIVANQWLNWGQGIRSVKEPLEKAIKDVIIPSIDQNFQEEGRPAWARLSIDTLYTRETLGFGDGPILQRKKKLYRAAISFARWTINGPEGRAYASSSSFNDVAPYAVFMQNGGKVANIKAQANKSWLEYKNMPGIFVPQHRYGVLQKRNGEIFDAVNNEPVVQKSRTAGGNIPPRPFMLIQKEDLPEIEKVFVRWFQKKMVASGAAIPTGTI